MSNFSKSLVEAEVLLNQLDLKYKDKIPNSFWMYIKENKDKNYQFYIDFNKTLENQSIMSDTIAILTYVNIEYLLSDKQKNYFKQIIIEEQKIAELKKKEKYSIDVFEKKQIEKNLNNNFPISINEKWYIKLTNKIKNFIKNNIKGRAH